MINFAGTMQPYNSTLFGTQDTTANNFFLMAGPCVIESESIIMNTAEKVIRTCERLKVPVIFKSSYRKANRSRLDSFSGIGDETALKILSKVRDTFGVPLVTDIHERKEGTIPFPRVYEVRS